MSFARFIVFDGDPLDIFECKNQWKAKNPDQDFKGAMAPISIEHEIQAWKLVADKVLEIITKFPTSIGKDSEKLAKDETLTFNQRNCIKYRIGE